MAPTIGDVDVFWNGPYDIEIWTTFEQGGTCRYRVQAPNRAVNSGLENFDAGQTRKDRVIYEQAKTVDFTIELWGDSEGDIVYDSDTVTVSVPPESSGDPDISIQDINVSLGIQPQDIDVAVFVKNNGSGSYTGDLQVSLDPTQKDRSSSIYVPPGVTQEYEYTFNDLDNHEYTVTAESGTNSMSVNHSVRAIDNVSISTNTQSGGILEASVSGYIFNENTNLPAKLKPEVQIGDVTKQLEEVTRDTGGTADVNTTVEGVPPGEYVPFITEVYTGLSSPGDTITVVDTNEVFSLTVLSVEQPQRGKIVAELEVTNTGSTWGDGDINSLLIDDPDSSSTEDYEEFTHEDVRLEKGETVTRTHTYNNIPPGSYLLQMATQTEGEFVERSIQVNDPPEPASLSVSNVTGNYSEG